MRLQRPQGRRGAANLLGGRAIRLELRGLTAGELGDDFDLPRMLNHGYLPRIYEASRPRRLLDAYVDRLPQRRGRRGGSRPQSAAFSGFLDAAALSDGEIVNISNVARECGVSSPTAKGYFGILEDTLLVDAGCPHTAGGASAGSPPLPSSTSRTSAW